MWILNVPLWIWLLGEFPVLFSKSLWEPALVMTQRHKAKKSRWVPFVLGSWAQGRFDTAGKFIAGLARLLSPQGKRRSGASWTSLFFGWAAWFMGRNLCLLILGLCQCASMVLPTGDVYRSWVPYWDSWSDVEKRLPTSTMQSCSLWSHFQDQPIDFCGLVWCSDPGHKGHEASDYSFRKSSLKCLQILPVLLWPSKSCHACLWIWQHRQLVISQFLSEEVSLAEEAEEENWYF